MTKNNFKKIQLCIPLIIFILLALVFWFLYREINNNDMERRTYETQFTSEANRRNEIKALNRSVEAISQDKLLLETHFTKSSDIVRFLNEIENSASRAGTKAEVTNVDIPKEEEVLSIRFKVSGGFEEIYKFIGLLENSPYILDLNYVSMQKSSDTNTAKWEADFRAKVLTFVN